MDGILGKNAHQPLRSECHFGKRFIIGQRRQHRITVSEISQSHRSVGTSQRLRPSRVSVIGEHLIPVLDQIRGEGMPHMTEADHADAFDGRFPRSFLSGGGACRSGRIASHCFGHTLYPL